MPNTFSYVMSTNPSGRLETYFHLFVGKAFRGLLTKVWNPLITYDLDGTKLLLPLSHDLPLFRRIFPQYNTALARIAAILAAKYPAMTIIDIGANVGDTVAVLRKTVGCPILCVEGDESFLRIFKKNAAQFVDVELVESFVGPSAGEQFTVATGGGTSKLQKASGGGGVAMRPLGEIVRQHPRFGQAKLIKIDTDGFDTKIIESELELLARTKAAVFLEYDPNLLAKIGVDGFSVFESLRGIGYRSAIVFENWGDYLLTADLDNRPLLQDIHSYYTGRRTLRYCDICVFHADDEDLARKAREVELAFAAASRR